MNKELDELKDNSNKKKDINSPEMQEFLLQLHNRVKKLNEDMRRQMEVWKQEDRDENI